MAVLSHFDHGQVRFVQSSFQGRIYGEGRPVVLHGARHQDVVGMADWLSLQPLCSRPQQAQ